MAKYLGETIVDVKNTPYKNYTKEDWAIHYIEGLGQIDGGYHKQWVLDQIARIIKGTPMIIKLAKWDDGKEEYRENTGRVSKEYIKWVRKMRGNYDEENECYEYGYDYGIAP